MAAGPKILIEVELGKKAVEKTDIFIYCDGQLIESHFDMSYDDLPQIAKQVREQYKDADAEAWCVGEDCMGGLHRWQIEI